MNEYDSNRILDFTKTINYTSTKNIKEADCYVLNTCHIREKATEKVYHEVGRVKKEFRDKKKPMVLIVGCVAQAEGEVLIKRHPDSIVITADTIVYSENKYYGKPESLEDAANMLSELSGKKHIVGSAIAIHIDDDVYVEFDKSYDLESIKKILSNSKGCKLIDEHRDGGYMTPAEAEGDYNTYVSRLRKDNSNIKAINLWLVSDNLLKGAALNTVQIAETLMKKIKN